MDATIGTVSVTLMAPRIMNMQALLNEGLIMATLHGLAISGTKKKHSSNAKFFLSTSCGAQVVLRLLPS